MEKTLWPLPQSEIRVADVSMEMVDLGMGEAWQWRLASSDSLGKMTMVSCWEKGAIYIFTHMAPYDDQ